VSNRPNFRARSHDHRRGRPRSRREQVDPDGDWGAIDAVNPNTIEGRIERAGFAARNVGGRGARVGDGVPWVRLFVLLGAVAVGLGLLLELVLR
jgi:hypothetical protein